VCVVTLHKKIRIAMETNSLHTNLKEFHEYMLNVKIRIQKNKNWTPDFTNAAVNEYYRFLQLHAKYPNKSIVPGKAIDEIWHDHILHTQSYMDFCTKNFGYYLHHQPDIQTELAGTNTSDNLTLSITCLKHTLELYKNTFGYEAPYQQWGPNYEQFTKQVPELIDKSNVKQQDKHESTCYTCRGCFTNSDRGGKGK
jgi:hypothetical protein